MISPSQLFFHVLWFAVASLGGRKQVESIKWGTVQLLASFYLPDSALPSKHGYFLVGQRGISYFLWFFFSLMKLRTRYCVELFPGKPSHMRFCRPRMTSFTRQIISDGTFLFTHTCQLSSMVGVHSCNLNFVHIHISLKKFHIYKWQHPKTFVKQERQFHRWGLLGCLPVNLFS